MATVITATTKLVKHPDDVVTLTFDFTNWLGSSETLTSASAITQSGGTGSDLTLGTATINASEITVNGVTIETGKAVQVSTGGGVDATDYVLTSEAVTTLTQTFVFNGRLLASIE